MENKLVPRRSKMAVISFVTRSQFPEEPISLQATKRRQSCEANSSIRSIHRSIGEKGAYWARLNEFQRRVQTFELEAQKAAAAKVWNSPLSSWLREGHFGQPKIQDSLFHTEVQDQQCRQQVRLQVCPWGAPHFLLWFRHVCLMPF